MTKSLAQVLYPDAHEDDFFYVPRDYTPIVRSFGKVLVRVDDEDYSGDTRVLLAQEGRYGVLNFGWGSCSGCDALLGCNSYEAVDRVIDALRAGIRWFDTLEEAQAYVADDENRQYDYSYHEENWQQFKSAVLEVTAND
jgi:hypothetical protein